MPQPSAKIVDRYMEMKGALPGSYIDYIESINGWEGDLGEQLGYVVLWNKETIQERWTDYNMAESLGDRWFAFGSDGGGEMLCFDLESKSDAVFHLPYIGMWAEDAMLRYESFKALSRAIKEVYPHKA